MAAFEFLLVSVRFEIKIKILFREKKIDSDVSRPFGSPVYRFGHSNSGAQKSFFNFLFEDFF